MRRLSRPEVPSLARRHPRACVDRYRYRGPSRDGFRPDSKLGAGLPAIPRMPLSRHLRLSRARSPSPRTVRPPFSREAPPRGSLDQAAAQRLLQLHPNARTHPRASDSRLLRRAALRSHSECALVLATLFREQRPSPLEERSRELRAATILPMPPLRRCKRTAKHDTESSRPIATPLAGGASTRPPLAAVTVGRQRWTARAEWLRAKDLPSRRLLPQYDVGEDSPPH